MSRLSRLEAGLLAGLALIATVAGATNARAQEAITLRLSWFATGYTSPFFLAVDKGWFKEAGLDVTIQESQGAGIAVQQVASGNSTFGIVTADAVIRVVAQGAPIKIIGTITPTNGYCVLVKADSGINSPKDLEGKSFGSTAVSAPGRMLSPFLKANNVPPDSVKRITVDFTTLYAGFLGGQFDSMAALSYDEVPRFDAKGVKVRCMEYADAGLSMIGYALVASLPTIQNKPETVRKFVAVTLKAYQYAFEHPDESAQAAKKLGGEAVQDAAMSVAQLKAFQKLAGKPLGLTTDQAMQSTVKLVKENLDVPNAPSDMSRIFTNEFLPK